MEGADDVVRGQLPDGGAAVCEAGSAPGEWGLAGFAVGEAVGGGGRRRGGYWFCVWGGGGREVHGVVNGREVGCWGHGESEGEGCEGECGERDEEEAWRKYRHFAWAVLAEDAGL